MIHEPGMEGGGAGWRHKFNVIPICINIALQSMRLDQLTEEAHEEEFRLLSLANSEVERADRWGRMCRENQER